MVWFKRTMICRDLSVDCGGPFFVYYLTVWAIRIIHTAVHSAVLTRGASIKPHYPLFLFVGQNTKDF